jgi:hypothetical protein
MPNLKNITDLPVAESVEGLNLIVNDNGVAKQIAAGAVGAPGNSEQLEMLIEADMLPAVYDVNGPILTDEAGNIILRY